MTREVPASGGRPGLGSAGPEVGAAPCRCEELLEQLYELIDSEISQAQCARLQAHLTECDTCREAADAETHLRGLLRRSCTEVAPSRLRVRVVTQIMLRSER